MSHLNEQDSQEEFRHLAEDKRGVAKETSHETGEYNEFAISGGLLSTSEEEESSSAEETATKAATAVGSSVGGAVGVAVGIGAIVVGTTIGFSTSLALLPEENIIGIRQAQCFFEAENIDLEEVSIQLTDEEGQIVQSTELLPTEQENRYRTEFSNLLPQSTYYVQGFEEGREISLEGENSFTTLAIPHYDIEIDESEFDKEREQYDLTFLIENPNEYPIEARLVCENDETWTQHLVETDGQYRFTLPTILSSYRLELYQEDYLVGQTRFSDYRGMELIDEAVEIGISSVHMGLLYGDIDITQIDVSIEDIENDEVIELEAAPDGYALYVLTDQLEAESDYLLTIRDARRPTLTYFSYRFQTIPVPRYEITIDDADFDIANGVYDLTFRIDNPSRYLVDAQLTCLNDETLNDFALFTDDRLTLTLPSPYSEYRLDLNQEGYDVGSLSFRYYTPMQVVPETLGIEETSFQVEVDLGDVPLEAIRAYLRRTDGTEEERMFEMIPIDGTSRIGLTMGGLTPSTAYTMEIRDASRDTFRYLSYSFETLASSA